MENEGYLETIENSFRDLVDGSIEWLPRIAVALLLILIGWIIAKFLSKWIGKLVDTVERSKPVKSTLHSLGAKEIDIDGVVSIFVYWAIMLIFFGAAVDVLGLGVLTETFNALVGFVPNILAAALIAALSFVAANIMYDIVEVSAKKSNIKAYKFLARATKVVVLVFGLPLAAAQLGLDLTIINNNITVVVAGFMLAFAIAFGWGGKDTAGKIVEDMYKNWKK